MFRKENRLIPGVKFSRNYFFSTPQFLVKEKRNGLAVNRFGVIVSKKIDKRAVARNKIKRFFRKVLCSLNKKLASGHDILFIVKKEVLSKTEEENRVLIKTSLEKLRG